MVRTPRKHDGAARGCWVAAGITMILVAIIAALIVTHALRTVAYAPPTFLGGHGVGIMQIMDNGAWTTTALPHGEHLTNGSAAGELNMAAQPWCIEPKMHD